jgi:hypothetical protein
MRAIFVDANPTLAEVAERLHRATDIPVQVNRNPDVKSADLPALLGDATRSSSSTTPHLPTAIAKQCKGLKHVVFLGTGARSYMNPEELAGRVRHRGPHHQGLWRHRRGRDGLRADVGRGQGPRPSDGPRHPRRASGTAPTASS